jgi:hypothetical protein
MNLWCTSLDLWCTSLSFILILFNLIFHFISFRHVAVRRDLASNTLPMRDQNYRFYVPVFRCNSVLYGLFLQGDHYLRLRSFD